MMCDVIVTLSNENIKRVVVYANSLANAAELVEANYNEKIISLVIEPTYEQIYVVD